MILMLGLRVLPFLIVILISFIIIKSKKQAKSSFVNKSSTKNKSQQNDFLDDLSSCETILKRIKEFLKEEPELKNIYSALNDKYEYAKKTGKKITLLRKTLQNIDWNLYTISEEIEKEKSQNIPDKKRLENLEKQRDNITQLNKRELDLNNEIENILVNFNTVYTKITLLNTDNVNNTLDIETEIQKILDHKLKVSEYEQELNVDFNASDS